MTAIRVSRSPTFTTISFDKNSHPLSQLLYRLKHTHSVHPPNGQRLDILRKQGNDLLRAGSPILPNRKYRAQGNPVSVPVSNIQVKDQRADIYMPLPPFFLTLDNQLSPAEKCCGRGFCLFSWHRFRASAGDK